MSTWHIVKSYTYMLYTYAYRNTHICLYVMPWAATTHCFQLATDKTSKGTNSVKYHQAKMSLEAKTILSCLTRHKLSISHSCSMKHVAP
jgi:hypothetical protein